MNILFVTHAPPDSPLDGARLIVHHLARQWSTHHTLYLCSLCPTDEDRQIVHENLRPWFVGAELVPAPRRPRTLKWAGNLAEDVPLWVRAYNVPALAAAIKSLLGRCSVDIVHCDTGLMAQYADDLQAVPRVIAPHDSMTLALIQQSLYAASPLERLAARWQVPRMRRYEATAYARFGRVIVVTERECKVLQELNPSLQVRVIPNGVDTLYMEPRVVVQERDSLAFLGAMDYGPNEDAALFFAEKVMPLIWTQRPTATFTVIGANPSDRIQALSADPRIRVTGTVADVRPYLAAATVIVCPMRQTGGIKNKVLEALAMGKAIVATPHSIDGLDLRDGEHLLLASQPGELSEACIQLLQDQTRRQKLGMAARAWACDHTWVHAAKQYMTLYEEVRAASL